jgi:hypothetical protein
MKYTSAYLDWYISLPEIRYDLRSSGIRGFKLDVSMSEVDLGTNYAHGNPETAGLLGKRYGTEPENVFISSEGATGQNTRITRLLAERNPKKTEAIVECPTYEPLLRTVQNHFKRVKRLERDEKDGYRLDADALRKLCSEKTGLLMLTNPHAPSGAIAGAKELEDVMRVACKYGFFVVCDEIYAEFGRNAVPTIFYIDSEYGVVTTSFTKAYGLGGLKLGTALARKEIVDELYSDVLNTVGNSPNVVQILASQILVKNMRDLEKHRQKWVPIKSETEKWFKENGIEYFPNKLSVTYWAKLPIKDSYRWTNEHAVPRYEVASVPGTFFLFKDSHKQTRSDMVRVGLGNIDPDKPNLREAFDAFERALKTYKSIDQK